MSHASPVTAGEDRVRLLYRMRARELFWRMLQRQGIDPGRRWWFGSETMVARAVDKCAACPAIAACRSWFSAPQSERVPGFCPNARVIEACRIMDGAAMPLELAEPRGRADPSVTELLAEPIVKQLMRADRVNSEILRHALTDTPSFTAAYAAPTAVPRRAAAD
jgi:Family of unknown function (DUF6455)